MSTSAAILDPPWGGSTPLVYVGSCLPQVDPLLQSLVVVEDSSVQALLDTYLDRDIIPALNEMTGGSFTVASSSSRNGVLRVRVDPTLANQAYRITASPSTDTLIEGGGWRGCKHGLYAWLEQLGCVRLGMAPIFQRTPSRSDLRLTLDIEKANLMDSMGMGWQGAPSGLRWPYGSGDTADSFRHQNERAIWQDWMNRPRAHYGSTDPNAIELITGTQGDVSFIGENLATLNADPDSFCQYGRTYRNSTSYPSGTYVTCNGNTYLCMAPGGVSAATGSGPTGTGTGIVDGTCTFNFYLAGARTNLSYYALHMTHEGHGSGASTDYSGTGGTLALYKNRVVSRYDGNAAVVVPEFADCHLSLGMAVGDGAPICMDDKCVNLHRNNAFGTGVIDADARPIDKCAWRNMRILALAKVDRPGNWTATDFAYDLQVRPPTPGFPMPSQQLIMLCNYGFERECGLPRTSRFEQWGARAALDGFQLGAYDFISPPAYNRSDARYCAEQAFIHFRAGLIYGSKVFVAETPFSVGSVGFHWWAMFKMAWDGPRSYDSLATEWCDLMFGAGAPFIRRSIDRWWADEWPSFTASHYELGSDFQNFHDADQAVLDDPGSRKRVAAFQAYLIHLHYKRTLEDLNATVPSEAAAEALVEAYLVHTWRTNKSVVIDCIWNHDVSLDSPYLSSGFKAKWHVPSNPALYPDWRAANPVAATDYDFADGTEIRTLFDAIRATYPSPTREEHATPNYTSLVAPYETSDSTIRNGAYLYGLDGRESGTELEFKVRSGTTSSIVLGFASTTEFSFVRLILKNCATGATVSDELIDIGFSLSGDAATKTFDLSGYAPGFYRLKVEITASGNGWRVKECPRDVPLTILGPLQVNVFADGSFDGWPVGGASGSKYFHVPRGKTHFSFHSGGIATIKLLYPDKTEATPVALGRDSYYVAVPPGMDDAVWRLDETGGAQSGTPRFFDIPNRYAPTKAQLIIATNLR